MKHSNLSNEVTQVLRYKYRIITDISLAKQALLSKVNKDLLISIALLEYANRSFIIQKFEYFLFYINLLLNRFFRIPLKDFTLGPLQLRASLIFRYYDRYTVSRQQYYYAAVCYISQLLENSNSLREFGKKYNGSDYYGQMLACLIKEI